MRKTVTLLLVALHFYLNAQQGLNVDAYLTAGNDAGFHTSLSPQDVQAWNDNTESTLFINYNGGNVFIGKTGGFIYHNGVSTFSGIGTYEPEARFHVTGVKDASLSSNGLLMIGEGANKTNIIFDANEIMARNNGSASSLFINRDGGDVVFFGNADGSFIVNDLPFGDKSNMQYESSTGKFFYDNSSSRYKENIITLEDDWTKILNTRPVTYTRPGNPSDWEYGYIAEEIDSIGLTSMVGYDAENRPEDVRYDKMIIYLIEMLKLQQLELERQGTMIQDQQSQISMLNTHLISRKPKRVKKKNRKSR